MSDFKKFIETNGKSFEDIKKTINDMVNRAVNSAVDSVVDDVTKLAPKEVRKSVKKSIRDIRDARKKAAEGSYKAEKIPRRLTDSDLVYKSDAPESSRIHYPHEARSDNMSAQDKRMTELISRMRELEICVRGQGIVKRAVELTIVEQGRFMENVEDDFARNAFCALPQPVYAAMSNSQLRTFFTWRTEARRGHFNKTDKPYVLLYCYELLNKIGAKSSVEAFDRLLEAWEGCREFAPYLNALMPRWLKDFSAFNDVTGKYPDINAVLGQTLENSAEREFSEIESGNYSRKLDFLADNSAYEIRKSVFFSEQTEPLIDAACEATLTALDRYFAERGIELAELICGKLKKDYSWTPFKDAVVNLDTADGFRPIVISVSERYCIKRGEPALELFEFAPSRGFIGYLLKSVEAGLRIRTGFNRKLQPKLRMLEIDFQNRPKLINAISEPDFPKVISAAVDEYCRKKGIVTPKKQAKPKPQNTFGEYAEYAAPKVEIDISKLGGIRDEAELMAKKLIIDVEPVEIAGQMIAEDEFSELIEDFKEELSPREDEELPLQSGNPMLEELDSDWQTFANNLTPVQLGTLDALLCGTVRAFCKERGLLPETVFEEINTEALSAFGDVVIESGELVSDYRGEIEMIVKAANL